MGKHSHPINYHSKGKNKNNTTLLYSISSWRRKFPQFEVRGIPVSICCLVETQQISRNEKLNLTGRLPVRSLERKCLTTWGRKVQSLNWNLRLWHLTWYTGIPMHNENQWEALISSKSRQKKSTSPLGSETNGIQHDQQFLHGGCCCFPKFCTCIQYTPKKTTVGYGVNKGIDKKADFRTCFSQTFVDTAPTTTIIIEPLNVGDRW